MMENNGLTDQMPAELFTALSRFLGEAKAKNLDRLLRCYGAMWPTTTDLPWFVQCDNGHAHPRWAECHLCLGLESFRKTSSPGL